LLGGRLGGLQAAIRSATPDPCIRPSARGRAVYLWGGSPGTPILSPNGSRIAFTALRQAQTLLWVRDLDSLEARPLSGTEGAQYPFWSPDSKWLGYFTQNPGKLSKIEAALP